MGSYLSKNMTNGENIITLADCKTQADCVELFIHFNDIHPNEYCKLALFKLKDLNESQKKDLNNIITSNLNNCLKWKKYCSTLSVQQIHYVGW
jgi:hypothetical protein